MGSAPGNFSAVAFLRRRGMSDEPVQVDPEVIRAHAASIEALTCPSGQAVAAARAVSAPSDAFGKLCAFLPPLFVDWVEADGITALKTAKTAVTEDAAKLRLAADESPLPMPRPPRFWERPVRGCCQRSGSNPLVADREDSTQWYSGISLNWVGFVVQPVLLQRR
jgi:hypothetical protein